jgi:hypothetical protein
VYPILLADQENDRQNEYGQFGHLAAITPCNQTDAVPQSMVVVVMNLPWVELEPFGGIQRSYTDYQHPVNCYIE